MDWLQWLLWTLLIGFYITCLFTVCRLTFQKGHKLLGIIGIFFPFLWLVGAILPAKPGSQFEVVQQTMDQAAQRQYSS